MTVAFRGYPDSAQVKTTIIGPSRLSWR